MHVWPVRLAGHFTVPEVLRGMVVFAHGSGSSRHSPRNRLVASTLNGAGFGTLLFDLLSHDEETDRAQVFDIPLLAKPVDRGHPVAGGAARIDRIKDRLFRREHRSGRGPVGGR